MALNEDKLLHEHKLPPGMVKVVVYDGHTLALKELAPIGAGAIHDEGYWITFDGRIVWDGTTPMRGETRPGPIPREESICIFDRMAAELPEIIS